jgi:hypothetical protein
MATYQIHVNEKKALGKSIVALLKSMPEAVTFGMPFAPAKPKKGELYNNLNTAFRDVREIMDGKQKRVTLDEFLDELRNSNA